MPIERDPLELQRDVLKCLERNPFNRGLCRKLKSCRIDRCGRGDHCAEVCAIGASRRRRAHRQRVGELLANDLNLFEVQISRSRWNCALDELSHEIIVAALQLNRRALDKIFEPVVGVGMLKTLELPASDDGPARWRWEIHEIVACSEQLLLEEALSSGRSGSDLDSYVCVRPVNYISDALDRVLADDLRQWQHPRLMIEPKQASWKFRESHIRWLRGLDENERLIRYGCDRNATLNAECVTARTPLPLSRRSLPSIRKS